MPSISRIATKLSLKQITKENRKTHEHVTLHKNVILIEENCIFVKI